MTYVGLNLAVGLDFQTEALRKNSEKFMTGCGAILPEFAYNKSA